MIRPWQTWTVFGLCLAVVLAAMGWVSMTAVRLGRAEAQARRQAALEEDKRLALWRMESSLAPLIARENARPYFVYRTFYPAQRAYTRMFAAIEPGEVLLPSELLSASYPEILLHFQIGPDGEITSPQVPVGNMRDLAESRGDMTAQQVRAAQARLNDLLETVRPAALLAKLGTPLVRPTIPEFNQQQVAQRNAPSQVVNQAARNQLERQARQQNFAGNTRANPMGFAPASASSELRGEFIQPVWIDSALLLVRRVFVEGQLYVQGCRLDWPGIKADLLANVQDLLPHADLTPVTSDPSPSEENLLAALPVRLIPGEIPTDGATLPAVMRWSLVVAWLCVVLAAAATAALLVGAVRLSERRGAFVSAVTHELRTPLTTFRMYSEMLAENMVTDASKRQSYLNTLCVEANRLGHLVENVLAYARLEKKSHAGRAESITVGELIKRVESRLAARAEQADLTLTVEVENDDHAIRVRTDPSAVEQILFNLVDNACKYANASADRRIELSANVTDRHVALRVRDHGQGIPVGDARRLFRPFHKSARSAANTAPGVGLGLALSRRLARSMGGDLRLETTVDLGASFVLTLPIG